MHQVYYENPYIDRLKTQISSLSESEGSFILTLQDTIIYPGGGGQLADRAWINGCPVTRIISENEIVYYQLNINPDFHKQPEVDLKIDWDFRYYNMQQHTGQHLISAVLHNMGFSTVSVHLGEQSTLIEVSGGILNDNHLIAVEDSCNALIRKALPVISSWVNKEQLKSIPLRKEAGNFEKLRIVEIKDHDYSACGGTHLNNTSEIGLLKITAVEKIRGNQRLHTKMGMRAYTYFKDLHHAQNSLTKILKVSYEEFEQRINGLLAEKKELSGQLLSYQKKLIPLIACEIISRQKEKKLIYFDNSDSAQETQDVAREIGRNFAVLGIFENRFYFVYPTGFPVNYKKFAEKYSKTFAMRGGGPEGFIQGIFDKNKTKLFYDSLKEFINK